jgi:hypothetical protein
MIRKSRANRSIRAHTSASFERRMSGKPEGKPFVAAGRLAIPLALAALLSACSGLTQLQDSLSKFDQGAHVVASSQATFFNGVHSVECEAQFYAGAYAYSKDDSVPIDLRGKCAADKLFLNSAQIAIRQKMLDALTLYADALQALGATGDDKSLDTNLQAAAGNINTLATNSGLSKADGSIATDVEAAIVGLTNMILDQKKKTDIQAAAKSQQANLAKIVDTLKAENLSLASGVDDLIGAIRANLAATLATTRQREGSAVFFDVVRARGYLESVSPFGSKGLDDSTGTSDPVVDPSVAVSQLNAALDGLVSANNAIANAGVGGINAAVADLVSRAQAARTFQAALGK